MTATVATCTALLLWLSAAALAQTSETLVLECTGHYPPSYRNGAPDTWSFAFDLENKRLKSWHVENGAGFNPPGKLTALSDAKIEVEFATKDSITIDRMTGGIVWNGVAGQRWLFNGTCHKKAAPAF